MMRRCFVSALFLFCSVFFAWAADTYEEISGSTGLFIDSVPSGAKVFIDGVERGLTPYNLTSIREGQYQIRLNKEGYEDRRFTVTIRKDSRVEVSRDLKEARGQLLLKIQPDPAAPASLFLDPRIMIDGFQITLEGFRIYERIVSLPLGWRNIMVEAFGFERISKSVYVEEYTLQTVEIIVKPAVFTLSNPTLRRKRFNPQSAGTSGAAAIGFRVSAPGRGLLEVLDRGGTLVYSGALGPFTTWQQQALWNGRTSDGSIAGDGNYTIRISAWDYAETERRTAELAVLVDSSIEIRPLTSTSSVPGLLLAASPETLPALSFQIEGSLLAGKPLLGDAWEGLPFATGFRFSPLDDLELAAAFSAYPRFHADTEWSAGASLKWRFRKPLSGTGADLLGAALALSYGWASRGPYNASGLGTGAALRLPLSYRLFQGTSPSEGANAKGAQDASGLSISHDASFDVLLSPLILWAAEQGYPDSMIPRLGVEGGALFSYRSIAAGLSFRWDYLAMTEKSNSGMGPFVSALELKWIPSNFYVSFWGAYWHWKNNPGAFFGLSIGVVY